MDINWDDIKYIFQLPLQWFKTISNKVFKAYGTNFLTIKDGMYGGMEFGIDEDGFADAVERAVESGYVTIDTDQTITGQKTFTKYVSVQYPNIGSRVDISPHGNLEIYTSPTSIYGGYIDFHNAGTSADYTSRIIDTSDKFQLTKSDSGMIQLYARGTGQVNFHAAANLVTLDNHPTDTSTTSLAVATVGYCQSNFGKVKTVNGTQPDSNGNVAITIPTQIVKTVDHISPDASGNIQLNAIRTINGHNGDSVGNFAGVVTSVNSTSPDTDGNVDLDFVTDTELTTTLRNYVTNTSLSTTLQGYVTSVHLSNTLLEYATTQWVEAQNYLTDADLSSYVTDTSLQTTLQDYVTQQDYTTLENTVVDLGDDVTELSTDVELLKLEQIKSVDGHFPDNNGAVSFNLLANKWLKSDANGHITTTNDTPITVSPSSSGYIYNNNGTVEYKDDEYVTLATAQTITATKTFTGSGVDVNIAGGQLNVTSSSYASALKDGALVLERSTGAFLDIGPTTNYTQLLNLGGTYGFKISDPYAINLNAPANQATLENHPTETSTSSKAIATVGYCQEKFLATPPSGYTPTTSNITVVTGISWNGTQIVATRTQLRFYKGVFVGTTNQTDTTINTVAYTP